MTPVDVVMAVLPAVGFVGSFVVFRKVWGVVTNSLVRTPAKVTPAMRVGSISTVSRKGKN